MFEVGQTATEGHLVEILHGLRAEGLSYEAITRVLSDRYGLIVSLMTVRDWLKRYPNEPAA